MKYRLKTVLAVSAAILLFGGVVAEASAQNIKAGLMLKKGFPGADPVNGMYEFFKSEIEKSSGRQDQNGYRLWRCVG